MGIRFWWDRAVCWIYYRCPIGPILPGRNQSVQSSIPLRNLEGGGWRVRSLFKKIFKSTKIVNVSFSTFDIFSFISFKNWRQKGFWHPPTFSNWFLFCNFKKLKTFYCCPTLVLTHSPFSFLIFFPKKFWKFLS